MRPLQIHSCVGSMDWGQIVNVCQLKKTIRILRIFQDFDLVRPRHAKVHAEYLSYTAQK